MSSRYAIGLDYGTNSCRGLLVDLEDGREVAQHVFEYPSGELGILTDPKVPHTARQHPRDYVDGLLATITGVLYKASASEPGFDPGKVVGIGVDSTGSTVLPVNREGVPLGLLPEFENRLSALTWLWKDHTAHAEAGAITSLAARLRPQYLAKCGGVYSSEWFWAKIWRCLKTDPEVFEAAHSWVELCDYLPGHLIGATRPEDFPRGVCAAGHKAMFNPEWGGLPDKEFLAALHPALADLRDRLYDSAQVAQHRAGGLSRAWAEKTGLREGIAVAVGGFDAHVGAVGAGAAEGRLVKVLGTSTCDILVSPVERPLQDIPGVCGIVKDSVLKGFHGIEAGQSAVGDTFLWFVQRLVPVSYGAVPEARYASLESAALTKRPGETGLLALDWNNGNRTVLVDQRLTGLLLGQTLSTEAHEIYRALIEATAFGALRIIDRIEEYGVPIREIISCGGLAEKNTLLLKIYADVTGRPIRIARSAQTCALGAALLGAVAAGAAEGGFDDVPAAQAALCGLRDAEFLPDPEAHAVYRRLYGLYLQLHDAFGVPEGGANLYNVMKDLLAIREEAHAQLSPTAGT
jgi:L-ribulokinase